MPNLYLLTTNNPHVVSGKVAKTTTEIGSGSQEGPPKSFYGLPHDAMVGEYVLSTPHNS